MVFYKIAKIAYLTLYEPFVNKDITL